MGNRIIMHADMDAFFASVEQAVNPEYRGKPVIVGGTGDRSVVSAASYEARRFGIHSAMPMSQARRLCPHAVFLPVNGALYHRYSQYALQVFLSRTPNVEPISIDEAYLDLTGTERLFGPPLQVARYIKRAIAGELKITCSIGLGSNRLLAKLASDWDKPDGLRWIRDEQLPQILDDLPVERLPGVGQVTARRLGKLGIKNIGQLRSISRSLLDSQFGNTGLFLHRASRGQGSDQVRPYDRAQRRKQVSEETTLAEDSSDLEHLQTLLLSMADNLARRLRKQGSAGRTVTLKVRFPNFKTVSHSEMLAQPSDNWQALHRAAVVLLRKMDMRGKPVRLIGLAVSNLCDHTNRQLSLFDDDDNLQAGKLDQACDELISRYGNGIIRQARRLWR